MKDENRERELIVYRRLTPRGPVRRVSLTRAIQRYQAAQKARHALTHAFAFRKATDPCPGDSR